MTLRRFFPAFLVAAIGCVAVIFYFKGLRTKDTNSAWALHEILNMNRAVLIFKEKEGKYPEKLADLIGKQIEDKNALIDPWGTKFIYSIKNNQPEIYSAGPNRLDEGGRGDDIALIAPK